MKIPGKKLGVDGGGSVFLRLHPFQKSDGPHVIHGRDGQLGGEIGGQSQKVGMDRQAAVRKQGAGERPVLQAEAAGIGEVLRKGKGRQRVAAGRKGLLSDADAGVQGCRIGFPDPSKAVQERLPGLGGIAGGGKVQLQTAV